MRCCIYSNKDKNFKANHNKHGGGGGAKGLYL